MLKHSPENIFMTQKPYRTVTVKMCVCYTLAGAGFDRLYDKQKHFHWKDQ